MFVNTSVATEGSSASTPLFSVPIFDRIRDIAASSSSALASAACVACFSFSISDCCRNDQIGSRKIEFMNVLTTLASSSAVAFGWANEDNFSCNKISPVRPPRFAELT